MPAYQEKPEIEKKPEKPTESLEHLAEEADKKVLEELEHVDSIRAQAEEEIEKQILHQEMSLREKIEEKLNVAAHIKNFPNFILDYSRRAKNNPHLLQSFKETIKIIFSSFAEITLPIVEFVDQGEKITPSTIDELKQALTTRIIDWLIAELNPYFKIGSFSKVLEEILADIQDIKYDSNEKKEALLENTRKFIFIENVRVSALLTNSVKVKLLEKLASLSDEQTRRLNQLLYGEIQHSRKHPTVITEYILEFLKEIEDGAISS